MFGVLGWSIGSSFVHALGAFVWIISATVSRLRDKIGKWQIRSQQEQEQQSQSCTMGNKPAKQENTRDEILVKAMPPIDRAFARWLVRDVRRLHDFAPRKQRAIKPPDHYIEYMRLSGWLDLDMDDPDLAHLIK